MFTSQTSSSDPASILIKVAELKHELAANGYRKLTDIMRKPNGRTREPEDRNNLIPLPQLGIVAPAAQQAECASLPTREVEFVTLPHGMVDLVRSVRHPAALEFLVCRDGTIARATQLEHDGELLVVPKIDSTIVSALRLPTTAKPCASVREIFTVLTTSFEKYVGMDNQHSFLASAFTVMSWFADRLPFVPYLFVCGPRDSGKTTLLRALHCMCRRAIHAGNITPAMLYRIAAQVRPTLLNDDAKFGRDRRGREFERLLRGGNRQGSRVLSNGKAFENFGPKVIASRLPLNDAALLSGTIQIVMTPSDCYLPSVDLEAEQQLADAVQPILETFRLLHYEKVAPSQYPGFLEFSSRLRDSARALAAPMLGDEELQERLAATLQSQADCMQLERFTEPESIVLLALFGVYHELTQDVYVADVTEEANRILVEQGEKQPYSPKFVGSILNHTLGFRTCRRGKGYRIKPTLGIGERIHRLAKTMGVKRTDIQPPINVDSGWVGPACDLCSKYDLNQDHEGRQLRDFDHPDFVGTLITDPTGGASEK